MPEAIKMSSLLNLVITEEKYASVCWAGLQNAIDIYFGNGEESEKTISFEEMYSHVYKSVANGFADQLSKDCLSAIALHFEDMRNNLLLMKHRNQHVNFFLLIHQYLEKFVSGLDSFTRIFSYMITQHSSMNIINHVNSIFRTTVLHQSVLNYYLVVLLEASSKPFMLAPHIVKSTVDMLLHHFPELWRHNPSLFSKYVPNVVVPSTGQELEGFIDEDRRILRELASDPSYIAGDRSRKRFYDDFTTIGDTRAFKKHNDTNSFN